MSERTERLTEFLNRCGWGDADRKLLAADASFRHYDRLTRGGESRVLMDAPPPMEDVRPFLQIDRKLEELGFSAPHVYAQDVENGFVLLEDFGDSTYTRLLKNGADERALYELAVDLLIDLHRRGETAAVPAGLARYDIEAVKKEVMLFPDWFMPAAFGRETDKTAVDDFVLLWEEVFPVANSVPQTLVLRDYHVDNLLLLKDRAGVKAGGLLDFQDALHGAADLLAEWLATAVNNEKIKSETNDRLVAMGGEALAEALTALGDSDAASEALTAAQNALDGASSTASTTESVMSDATHTLQQKFNVKIFQLVLLIVAAAAIFMLILSCAMFASHHSKRKKAFEKKQRARRAAARKKQAARQRREREE